MYKDKDKQREAGRERARRFRNAHKNNAQEVTPLAGTRVPNHQAVIDDAPLKPTPKRGLDIKVFSDLPLDVQQTIDKMSTTDGKLDKDEKAKRTTAAIKYQHLFPDRHYGTGPWALPIAELVTGKPGDADYNGVCTEAWRAERGR